MEELKAPGILVVAAHVGDFVWRCGGTIAKYAARGSRIKVLILSDGLRGEANAYWKQGNATEMEGHALREAEGMKAAVILGVHDVELWGLSDYPLLLEREHIEKLAHVIRSFRPDLILTHSDRDAFNPDHNDAHTLVRRACATSSAAGWRDGLSESARQTPILGFEPHMTEASNYMPSVYVDVSESFAVKVEAMKAFESQPNMSADYIRKAELRGNEARNRGGRKGCVYAEAFKAFQPIAASGELVW